MLDSSRFPSHAASQEHERASLEQELVLEYMGLAESIARGYSRGFGEPSDIRQVAFLGLVKSAKRFDPDKGSPFAAFARATISGEIKRYFRDHTWAVRPPRSVQELSMAVAAATPALEQRLGHSPTRSELAADLSVDEGRISEGFAGGRAMFASSLDELEGNGAVPVTSGDPADDIASRVDLRNAMSNLAERDRTILHLRYVKGLTQSEIAQQIGTSQVHVSRALARVLAQVRSELGKPYGDVA